MSACSLVAVELSGNMTDGQLSVCETESEVCSQIDVSHVHRIILFIDPYVYVCACADSGDGWHAG